MRIVDCRKCRRFVWCEWPKIVFYKVSGIECDEYEDGEGMQTVGKPFKCANGITYELPENHCVFCEHCTDIIYDYSNGPYMFLCDKCCEGYETCGEFEEEKEVRCNEEDYSLKNPGNPGEDGSTYFKKQKGE